MSWYIAIPSGPLEELDDRIVTAVDGWAVRDPAAASDAARAQAAAAALAANSIATHGVFAPGAHVSATLSGHVTTGEANSANNVVTATVAQVTPPPA